MTTKFFAVVLAAVLFATLALSVNVESKQNSSEQNPSRLVVSDLGKYVQVNWDLSAAQSTTGVNVYRTTNSADDWQKLNAVPVRSTTFVDYAPPRPALVWYRVTYLDGNGLETAAVSVASISTNEEALSSKNPEMMASVYSKNDIITDSQLTNANAMSLSQIQTFLSNNGSVLANYSVAGKTAAQHIYDACQTQGISPQVVLVTLQKEKGLIRSSTGNPENFAMGWNTGDSSVSGFADQIFYGTRQFRLYYNNLGNYNWVVGQSHSVSDGVVTAANIATAGLYIYTPWIGQGGGGQVGVGGNYLFWDLWQNTFAFGNTGTTAVVEHPNGWIYPTGSSNYQYLGWLHQNPDFGNQYHLAQDMANPLGAPVYAVDTGDVILSTTQACGYGGPSGQICDSAGNRYGGALIVRHRAKDGTWFTALYGHVNNPLPVGRHVFVGDQVGNSNDWNPPHVHFGVRIGPNVTSSTPYRGYTSSTSQLDGFTDPIAFLANFQACKNGTSVNFRPNNTAPVHPNGTLIKSATDSTGTVYVLRNGQKQGIVSPDVLRNLYPNGGFDFKDVITIAQDEFNSYPAGSVISSQLPSNGRTHSEGRLIKRATGGEISIVTDNGMRRGFVSAAVFSGLGYLFCNVVDATDANYDSYPAGDPITGTSTCNGPGSFSLSSPGNGQSLATTSSVTLSWGTSANATSYDVYFGTSSNPGLLATQSSTSRSVSVTPGQTYFWKVVAKVSCGSATFTTPISSFSVQQQNFTISVSALPSNGGSVSGGGTFTAGSSRTVTATANSGFTFSNWTENSSVVSFSSSYTFTLNSNRTLVANFTSPVNYTISVSASPAAGGTVSGGGTFADGSSRTVSATANSGYTFANWTENGSVVSFSPSYTFTLTSNRSLVANFTQVNFTIAVNASPSNGGTVSGGGTFAGGSSPTVTATANTGFDFANWTENGTVVSSSSSYNFTLNSNRNLVANFTPQQTNINYALVSNGGVASASSTLDVGRSPVGAINGDRTGRHWGTDPDTGSGWHDATANAYPDWLQVDFNGVKTIDEIDVFTLQDNFQSPVDPTTSMIFTTYGLTAFDVQYWNGSTWVTVPGGSVTGNNKVWRQFTGLGIQTSNIRVLVNNALNAHSRIVEVEAWRDVTTAVTRSNVALSSNGGTASASSTLDAGRSPVGAINGDRTGQHWGTDPATGSGWHDATANTHPDWLQVDFNGVKALDEIDVYTLQDNFQNPVEPNSSTTFSVYGITAFDVQYWDGSNWVTVPGGSVSGNNKVWRQFSGLNVQTTRIRVQVNGALNGYSRIVELEAWGTPVTPLLRSNAALAINGAVATASSTLDVGRSPSGAINGDRTGRHWGTDPDTGSGWHDATSNAFPDWLQIDFNGVKTVDEIDVYTLQDNFQNPVEPTNGIAFTTYGITAFDVQYWNGSSWVTVPGGSVTGNDKVMRQFTGLGIQTSRIRVQVNSALNGYSRIVEVEAWSTPPVPIRP